VQQSQFHLLKSTRFLPLFVTQFLGAFNDNAYRQAMVILVTYGLIKVGGNDPRVLITAAAGVFILPFFLFSAIAGQLADKLEKSRLILFVKLAEMAVMDGAGRGRFPDRECLAADGGAVPDGGPVRLFRAAEIWHPARPSARG
jgi:acyl-[acyl-carrier-protein]-phospholipid O-acyltransferase/long-chain-fatty-acid--[acyl-carrier-protein] ligase